jgi:hypothetical protein
MASVFLKLVSFSERLLGMDFGLFCGLRLGVRLLALEQVQAHAHLACFVVVQGSESAINAFCVSEAAIGEAKVRVRSIVVGIGFGQFAFSHKFVGVVATHLEKVFGEQHDMRDVSASAGDQHID